MSKANIDDVKVLLAIERYSKWLATEEGAKKEDVDIDAAKRLFEKVAENVDRYSAADGKGGKKELFFTIDL